MTHTVNTDARSALAYFFDTSNGCDGRPRIIDLCFTAFIAHTKKNAEDGGPCDWFNDTKPLIDEHIATIKDAILSALPQVREGATVAAEIYEAAVKGRQDFRDAYRKLLPVLRAAETISQLWRSPQQPFQVSDAFADAINALDIAVTGGGAKPIPFEDLAAAPKPTTEDAVPEGLAVAREVANEASCRHIFGGYSLDDDICTLCGRSQMQIALAAAPKPTTDPKAAVEAERERCARIADAFSAENLRRSDELRESGDPIDMEYSVAFHRKHREAAAIAAAIRTTDGARP